MFEDILDGYAPKELDNEDMKAITEEIYEEKECCGGGEDCCCEVEEEEECPGNCGGCGHHFKHGDVVQVGTIRDICMVCQTEPGNFQLISLLDANRWDDTAVALAWLKAPNVKFMFNVLEERGRTYFVQELMRKQLEEMAAWLT